MLRFLLALVLALALVATVTRAHGPRRFLFALLGLMVLYTILKLTGVIDAMAPSRYGVF
ncbi:MAG TPA: hypothetical protein PKA33_17705 [Amaricoccus sp.]|uniref:hypothetical protein n=1 Tax=Amaricoccus sp. TaxID=1872485 RepID=UPI002CE40832|nr:hypothetical protein [Amaricoccus sp.]HMQ93265.1 hypothetical protein [Amaricoccus sp.]HMR54211.1 hypothetical protein [Amaricoccus sp.]HMR60740.1 hypothetical protein [Amaricoccus sp.]HMU01183.1 hypothetical protein [Amaricoccus sp.]